MKTYEGLDVQIHVFFTSALVGGVWSFSRPSHFIPPERAAGTHWIGGWADTRASLEVKIFYAAGLEL
jgi:hypothetical protein